MSRSYVTFEKIGTCELCGATDHHLIEGVCPGCRPKTATLGSIGTVRDPKLVPPCETREGNRYAATLRRIANAVKGRPDDVPLGAEANVSHVQVPRGRAR